MGIHVIVRGGQSRGNSSGYTREDYAQDAAAAINRRLTGENDYIDRREALAGIAACSEMFRDLLAIEETVQITVDDKVVDYATLVNLMDNDLREELHAQLVVCSHQEFVDAYLARDPSLREAILSGGI